jgi:hypothetical protein
MSEEQGSPSSREEAEEEEGKSMSRERFLERVNGASNGNDLLDFLVLHKGGAIQSP